MSRITAKSPQKVLADLCKCGLLRRDQVQMANDYLRQNPRVGPRTLTESLVSQDLLLRAQADEFWAVYDQRLTVSGYTLIEPIGRGSLGIVYKAVSANDDREYAVKVLPRRNVGSVGRIPQRLQAFLQFNQAPIVPLVQVGTAADRHYLIWPYVTDDSLETHVKREGALSPRFVVHYALQLTRGLAACHDQGLFHGLLKPSNIQANANHKIQLLDFGIGFLLTLAREESLFNTLTTTNQLSSFVDFASPESILSQTNRTPLGDQYSLGCVLYYCLTGRVPFPQEHIMKKMMAQQFEEPVPIRELNPKVPARLAEIVARFMQKAPEERFASMAEAEEALQALLARSGGGKLPDEDEEAPELASASVATQAARRTVTATATKTRPVPVRQTETMPAVAPVAEEQAEESSAPEAPKPKVGGIPPWVWVVAGILGALAGSAVVFLTR